MVGLPCTVSSVLVLVLLGTVTESAYVCQTPVSPKVSQTPEKCMNKVETGSEMSNEERQSAVDAVNLYRAFIVNQCDKFKSGRPLPTGFQKIRYACDYEQNVKFDCPAADAPFVTDDFVFRRIIDTIDDYSIFYRIAPRLEDIGITNVPERSWESNYFEDESVNGTDTFRFYLNSNSPEIGCYLKTCYEKKYLACKTYYPTSPKDALYYEDGSRCESNDDCKDPAYPVCDVEFGMCEQGKLPYRCGKHETPTVRRMPEKCLDSVDTGSDMSNRERQLVVDSINLHRGFVANECDAWGGDGKPKSANLLKVHYSCERELRIKFECPSDKLTLDHWHSDEVYIRGFRWGYDFPKRSAFFWVLAKQIKPAFLRFALNNKAVEVGCFLKDCNAMEHIACTTGVVNDDRKPLYTPGNRCQQNADCTVAGYPICDMEYGLCDKAWCQKDADCTDAASPVCNLKSKVCGSLTCKFSDLSLTVDVCKDLRACTEATDNAEPEKQFCRSTVIIAERNSDNSFTVKGFGAAVGEKHLLSSVTSEFQKYGTSELYVIVGGTRYHQLRAADVLPKMFIGSYKVTAWQDLTLVELSAKSTFKFNDYLKIKKVDPQDKSLTLQMAADKIIIKEMSLKPDAECEKIFSLDSTLNYASNSNMACGLDDNDKGTRYLSGVPCADMTLTDGKHTLHGVRSVASLDRQHKNGFLVTKLAPNCDWLFTVSKGALKCI